MKRVLVVNPFGIGDVLFSMRLVEALRLENPGAFIGFLCNERTVGLVRLNTSIDRTYVFNRDLFRKWWRQSPVLFWKELRAFLWLIRRERFDTLFDLSLGRQYSFFGMLIGIPARIGFDYKGRGIFLTRKRKLDGYQGRPVAEIQLGLLEETGISFEKKSLKIPIFVSKKAPEETGERLLAVAPGGGRSWGKDAIYKQWDPAYFAAAVGAFAGYKVVLLGDESEKPLLMETANYLQNSYSIMAGEPMDKVCSVLLRSRALLCNDGGLMHLANALGVKTVSIFGPVDEKVYGPYDRGVPSEVVTQPVPCRPCYQKFHFPPCPYERRCLTKLGVDKVVAALSKVL